MQNIRHRQFPPREDTIDVFGIAAGLWQGKITILLSVITSLALAACYLAYGATPMYRATSSVILDPPSEPVTGLGSVVGSLTGDSTQVNSEVEVLRARGLMEKLADRLNVTLDPEFNERLRPPGVLQRAAGFVGLELLPELNEIQIRDAAVDRLIEHITVQNLPFSMVFTITAESRNAGKSARIADTLVELYLREQLDEKYAATKQATDWLTGQVATLQAELELSERQVTEFSSRTELISAGNLQALERQLKDLRSRVTEAEQAARQSALRVAAMQAAPDMPGQAEAAADDQLNHLMAAMLAEPGAGRELQFRDRYAVLSERARQEATRAQERYVALAGSLGEIDRQLASRNADLIHLQQLTREADASRVLYQHFLTRLKETSVQLGVHRADSRVLSAAVVPVAPSSPRVGLILAIAAFCGAASGVALVMMRQARRSTFLSVGELEDGTGYAVLGEIPEVTGNGCEPVLSYLQQKPLSAAAEAVRNLRTSLMLSDKNPQPVVILSASALPEEGKTTVTQTLARNFSDIGKKVLLIEGDIRRPGAALTGARIPGPGLIDVLAGNTGLKEAANFEPATGSDVLRSGATNVSAADLFSSDAFCALLKEARETWDVIFIDSPPVLMVPDARIIGRHVDAILFSVRWDHTTREQINAGLRKFESLNQNITGLVLNRIGSSGLKHRGYGYVKAAGGRAYFAG